MCICFQNINNNYNTLTLNKTIINEVPDRKIYFSSTNIIKYRRINDMAKETSVYKKIREQNDKSQETVASGTGISRDKIGAFESN